mmetsp:Transcript_23454/g.54175  ORF Transcript_23454/g.54175 Transcript_23454/m.54175 type:complete len:1084 (-) Transcript_23454:93-3344(-)
MAVAEVGDVPTQSQSVALGTTRSPRTSGYSGSPAYLDRDSSKEPAVRPSQRSQRSGRVSVAAERLSGTVKASLKTSLKNGAKMYNHDMDALDTQQKLVRASAVIDATNFVLPPAVMRPPSPPGASPPGSPKSPKFKQDSPRSDSPKYGNAPDSSKHKPKKHKRDKPKDQPDARLAKFASEQSMNGLVRYTKNHMKNQDPLVGTDTLKVAVLEEQWQLTSFVSLPMTTLFFVIFMVFFQRHYTVINIFFAEANLRQQLGPSAEAVSDIDGLFSWMDETYFPFVWDMKGNSSQQELVGGVLIQMSRSQVTECEDSVVPGIECYPDGELQPVGEENWFEGVRWGIANPVEGDYVGGGNFTVPVRRQLSLRHHQNETSDERRLRTAPAHLRTYLPLRYPPEEYVQTFFVPKVLSLMQVREIVADLKALQVLQPSTTLFGLQVLVHNAEFENALLTQVWSRFSFGRGGTIWTENSLETLVLEFNFTTTLVGVIWAFFVLTLSVLVAFYAWQALKRDSLVAYLTRVWNALEVFLSVYGIVVLIMLAIEIVGSLDFVDLFDKYRSDQQLNAGYTVMDFTANRGIDDARGIDAKWFLRIVKDLQNTFIASTILQVLIADYHIVLLVRFVLASRGQPRLAIIVNTMRKAMVDFAHLLLVMAIIYAAYVSSGHILFGARVEAYSTLPGALADCFSIVLTREYSWEELTEWDFWTVTIWVWSFMLLVVLVLVNIVLAMIFETYAEVREGISSDSTVWKSASHLLTMFKYFSSWVPTSQLMGGINEMEGDKRRPKMVGPNDIKDAFPDMLDVQVDFLFEQARTHIDTAMKTSMNAFPEAASCLLMSLETIRHGIQEVREQADAEDARNFPKEEQADLLGGAPPTKEPDWVAASLRPRLQQQQATLDRIQMRLQHCRKEAGLRGLGRQSPAFPGEMPETPPPRQLSPHPRADDQLANNMPQTRSLGAKSAGIGLAAYLNKNWAAHPDPPPPVHPNPPQAVLYNMSSPRQHTGLAQTGSPPIRLPTNFRTAPVATLPQVRPPPRSHFSMLSDVNQLTHVVPASAAREQEQHPLTEIDAGAQDNQRVLAQCDQCKGND